MSIQDVIQKLRQSRIESGLPPVPTSFQTVTKRRIEEVLSRLDGNERNTVDCVFALLDNETEGFKGLTFSDGVNTARLGSHIALLQREGNIKLDREGRDYWIKPLRAVGAIELVTFVGGKMVAGHIRAKSGNSAYRLNQEFIDILKSPDGEWEDRLNRWIQTDVTRRRLEMQAKAAAESKKAVETGHAQLIQQSITTYAKNFLPDFEVLYVDDADGDRISEEQKANLKRAGVALGLDDAFPDALLWNPKTDWLWCIEAVTSDGEVDDHKVEQMGRLVKRHKKAGIGFTTTYRTWKEAASRQDSNRNLAIGSHVWIASDPSRQFEVKSFEPLSLQER